MEKLYRQRGFLPEHDPLTQFPTNSPLAALDVLGHDLPSLLHDPGCRTFLKEFPIPAWPGKVAPTAAELPLLHLYYVRMGFIASAYVNQVGQPPANLLPRNLALPLAHACNLLQRPPILSYDGYALFNWKRFNPERPIMLGNIDTIQNFIHLYDEHWFILVHVEIEAQAAEMLDAIAVAGEAAKKNDAAGVNGALKRIGDSMWRQVSTLRRIPEHMDAELYYRTFRPYIRFFEKVVYEGVSEQPMDHRGETGAQSSVVPAVVSFMKVPHTASVLTNHLDDMRRFMPAEHRAVLKEIEALPSVKPLAEKHAFNEVLEALATFREVHFGWAEQYIHRHVPDPRGTGGTPYRQWLRQLIDETRGWRID